MVRTSAIAASTIAALALSASLAAQSSAPQTTAPVAPAAPAQTPQFRTTANVVEIDVAVTDRAGKPITNLTSDDFDIREADGPQVIQTMFLVSADPAVLTSTPPLDARTEAIVPARRELRQRFFVFVVDTAHLSPDGVNRTRKSLETFFKMQARPRDTFGLVIDSKMLNNRLTSDVDEILKGLAGPLKPNMTRFAEQREFPRITTDFEAFEIARGDAEAMGRAERRACGEQPQECNGMLDIRTKIMEKARRQNTLARTDALSSLQSIETLANGLGRFPGVKQVVLFSEGYFIEEAKDVLANLAARAAQSNVRISALDARGLGRLNSTTPIDSMGSLSSPGDFGQIDTNEDVLTSMAIDTGGAFVNNANDLAPSLAAISAQASTYYVIGYAPTRPFDGAWRTISVRIKRPDVVVHARKGYVANGTLPSTSGVTPSISSNAPSTSSSVAPAPSTSSSAVPAPGTSGAALSTLSNVPSTSSNAPSPPSTSSDASVTVDTRTQRDFQARAGLAAYARGDLETAQAELQRAVASGNAPTATRYRLGQVEYALAHYDIAADVLAGVVRDAPDFQGAYFDLADAYFSTNRFADAVRILREATRRWPKDSDAQNAYGVALTRRGALEDAIGAFQAAVAIGPNDGVSHYNLARAYHLRYLQAQRNAAQTAMKDMTSIGDEDRRRAIAEYTRYLQIGGPFDEHARDGLKALQWK